MNVEHRFRVVLTPKPHQVEHARFSSSWPQFDVIDPPAWLAEMADKDIPHEFFQSIPRMLAAEGYEFIYKRLAWVKP